MDGFLLVDDSDGRVLAAFDDPNEALQAFEQMLAQTGQDAAGTRQDLCLVRFDRRDGSLVGTETTWRMRVLP